MHVSQATQTLHELVCTGNSFVVAQACFRLRTLRGVLDDLSDYVDDGGSAMAGRAKEELLGLYKILESKSRLDVVRGRRKRRTANAEAPTKALERLPTNSFRAQFAKLHRRCHHTHFVRQPFAVAFACLLPCLCGVRVRVRGVSDGHDAAFMMLSGSTVPLQVCPQARRQRQRGWRTWKEFCNARAAAHPPAGQ